MKKSHFQTGLPLKPKSAIRKFGFIFLILIMATVANGVYTIHHESTNEYDRTTKGLEAKLEIANTILLNEMDKLEVVAGIVKGQQLKLLDFMDQDKLRPIKIILQSISSKHNIELLLLFDENQQLLTSSRFQDIPSDATTYKDLLEGAGLSEVPVAIFPDPIIANNPTTTDGTVLCLKTTVALIHDLGNTYGTVVLLKLLQNNNELGGKMAEMTQADILIYNKNEKPVLTSFDKATAPADSPNHMSHESKSHFSRWRALSDQTGKHVGKLIVAIDSQPFRQQRSRLLINNLLPSAIIIFLSITLFIFLKYKFINRVNQLSNFLRAVSAGEASLSSRLQVPDFQPAGIKRPDEVELMCHDFNRMMDMLESTFKQTQDQAQLLQSQQEELRQANTELVEQAKQLSDLYKQNKMILNAAGEGIHGVDINGLTTFVNKAALRMTGFTKEELLGKNQHELIHHTKEDGSPFPLDKCLLHLPVTQGNIAFNAAEALLWRKDGSNFPVEYIYAPIIEGDVIKGAVVVYKDITDRKRIEEEKKNIQGQLLQSQKMEAVGTLAGGVAHDFNNMLTLIQGYTDMAMMKIDEENPVYDGCLKEINNATGRAADLTRQLLLFSRRQPMEYQPINLSGLTDNLLKMLSRLIGEDITISSQLAPDLPNIMGDNGNIEQVVMNLAINTKDAMPQGGKLRIKTESVIVNDKYCERFTFARPGRFVCLSITDNGIGMSEETQRNIFDPFFTTKKEGKGTGLGLSVAYGIVQQHDGWITVESKPGRGSDFKVFWPVTASSETSPDPGTAEITTEVEGAGQQILLIEDDERVCRMASTILSENNYKVTACKDAEEAIKVFEQENGKFDLVFSDVVLPGINGIQLADKLRSKQGNLPIVLTSGYTDDKSKRQIVQDRGFPFLRKPYEIGALLNAIHEALADQQGKGYKRPHPNRK